MKKSILIIEDDPFLGDILSQKLRKEEFDVTLVADGGEGLKQISARKPDLVLLDIILPTMNGYEILEARQKDPAIATIPVIIISNSGQPVEINRALSLGIKDYLVKAQMDPDDVLAKVRKFFQGAAESSGEVRSTADRLLGQKVLWIEDDSFLSDLAAAKLKHEGCTALYAKDGEQALEILKTEVPNIIMLDLVLPGMSGFDVLQAIRQNHALDAVPVVVLSNLGQEKDIEKSKQLGAIKHLVKAEHDLDEIIGEILTVLKK
jgi:DNA-binding response OmpR family regulator